MRAAINFCSVAALALASLAVAPAQAGEDGKQAMFDAVDRNADADRKRSATRVYYFGELGMQEIESAKLLKGVLEAAASPSRPAAPACRPISGRNGAPASRKIVIVTEIDALPGGSQTPATPRPQAAGRRARPATWKATTPMAASPSTRPIAVKQAMQRYNIPGTRRGLVRSRRGADREPAVPGARRLFQGVDADIYPAHRRRLSRPVTGCRTTPRSARSSPFTARPLMARLIRGTARTRSMRSS